MNSEIVEKKNLKKYDFISIINKDEGNVEGTKGIKSRKLSISSLTIIKKIIYFFACIIKSNFYALLLYLYNPF